MFFQCSTKPCARTPAMMIRKNVIVASAAVTLKLPVAVTPPCSTRAKNDSSGRCRKEWLMSAARSKIGNQTDDVRRQDEQEQRQQERRVDQDPLRADVRQHDRVADELDEDLERRHEPGGLHALLPEVAPHGPGDDEEHRRRDEPQHQHVLGHRKIDPEDLRQMDQRMVERRVGDVADDHFAGVEAFGGLFRGVFSRLHGSNLDAREQQQATRGAPRASLRRTDASETAPQSRAGR